MLELKLRQEFQGKRLKGTQIELEEAKKQTAQQFLDITYPSDDLLKVLEAVTPSQGLPVVLLGERGQGKSHLMAALYHMLNNPDVAGQWLQRWATQLNNSKILTLSPRRGVEIIDANLNRQEHKYLWDLLFQSHPHGQETEAQWTAMGDKQTDTPPYALLLSLFQKKPTVLILDEFQTWYDGIKSNPNKHRAFGFIQNLSEIAKDYPNLLALVVSVRDSASDAYAQIHRVNPTLVNFKGANSSYDRRRLLLHRLFENRIEIADRDIENLISAHINEYFRLASVSPVEYDRKRSDFIESWPFAPHLMQLLEDQVLVATEAQETRDLVKILAGLFKQHGGKSPLITAADFRVDDDASGITALLDSVSNQHHRTLLEKAKRNLEAVRDAVKLPADTVPHLSEIIGALWLRSLAVENLAGAEPAMLQIDITRSTPIDENAFQVELSTIVENSFNIHLYGNRYIFREDENAQTKLMAHARNDRLFTDGSDHAQLAKQVRYVLGGSEDVARAFRVIVLSQNWLKAPWADLDPSEHPDRWDDRFPIVVLPEDLDKLDERLGNWLKDHVQRHRNTIRFLLPRIGSLSLYQDRDLLVLARAVLKADEWKAQNPEYRQIKTRYEKELQSSLKQRFDRFAILSIWNYADPKRCRFTIEGVNAQGEKIPTAIEEKIRRDVFIPEDFEAYVQEAAGNNDSVGKLLQELQEPRPKELDCIPWLGETYAKEKLVRICARGRIALELRGMEYLQAKAGEDEDSAWNRMKGRLGTGKHLDETKLLLPQAVPSSEVVDKVVDSVPADVVDPSPVPSSLFGANANNGGEIVTPPIPNNTNTSVGYADKLPPSPTANDSIFGTNISVKKTRRTAPATSALNLYAKVSDEWGISPATQIQNLSLQVGTLTGAQLQKLLKNLPDGLTYALDLEREEN